MRTVMIFVTGFALAIYIVVAMQFHVELLFGTAHIGSWTHFVREWFNLLTLAGCFGYFCWRGV